MAVHTSVGAYLEMPVDHCFVDHRQKAAYVFDVPVSSKVTALFFGAAATVVETV